ncbi:MAG TPA: NAD(P)H-hydrate dehydratase [bacterium]|nr:NAD(P)H-hydrate dehydratase [bacterium]
MKRREKNTHKGDYGHLFILGGSPGMTGAVCLAACAALRSGCGLVTVGIPESLNAILEIKLTEAMSLPLPETGAHTFSVKAVRACLEFINERADGVLIGPGISTNVETSGFVKQVISGVDKPIVIDADAIKIISGEKKILKKIEAGSILTPHPGEMSCLTGMKTGDIQKNREKTAGMFAEEHKTVVVLKGHRTVVTDGKRFYTNLTGNPGMATAGSGDVLAGIIGSFLVQGVNCFEAARQGVYIHGLAGDFAVKDKGEASLVASDIIEHLPSAFMHIS